MGACESVPTQPEIDWAVPHTDVGKLNTKSGSDVESKELTGTGVIGLGSRLGRGLS
jgi:hypothetical protein